MTAKSASFSWHGRLNSFSYAFAGLGFLVAKEHNMRIHIGAAILVIVTGIILKLSAPDWRWIGLSITLVFFTEALNTAIEKTCDALCGQYNEQVKIAKDVAAGAVLISCGFAVFVGLSVMLPYLMAGNQAVLGDMPSFDLCTSSK